jgi:hypothetical protein
MRPDGATGPPAYTPPVDGTYRQVQASLTTLQAAVGGSVAAVAAAAALIPAEENGARRPADSEAAGPGAAQGQLPDRARRRGSIMDTSPSSAVDSHLTSRSLRLNSQLFGVKNDQVVRRMNRTPQASPMDQPLVVYRLITIIDASKCFMSAFALFRKLILLLSPQMPTIVFCICHRYRHRKLDHSDRTKSRVCG